MRRPLVERFTYPHGDPSVRMFAIALDRWRQHMDLAEGARVLEIGCCETDWARWMRAAGVDVTGVDVRDAPGYAGRFVRGDAMELELFPPSSFEAVVFLGSLEHIGLGYYGDPVSRSGDITAVINAVHWLAPGGWLYYDVPWTPRAAYTTENRHFRVYSDHEVTTRLSIIGGWPIARAYCAPVDPMVDDAHWQTRRPDVPGEPFWYLTRLLQKVP